MLIGEALRLPLDASAHTHVLFKKALHHIRAAEWRLAFAFADRLCRLNPDSSATSYLVRSLISRQLGDSQSAQEDMLRAYRIDPTDPFVNHAILNGRPDPIQRNAALSLLNTPGAGRAQIEAAAQFLKNAGEPIIVASLVDGDKIGGWCAWKDPGSIHLFIETPHEKLEAEVFPESGHAMSNLLGNAASLAIGRRVQSSGSAVFKTGSATFERDYHPVYRRSIYLPDTPTATASTTMPPSLSIIVPVYGDCEATLACLESLAQQLDLPDDAEIIVVDDRGPDPTLTDELSKRAANKEFNLIRNERNFGYIASVNAGLRRAAPNNDVLLLNADALLPPTAVARLAQIAASDPNVGLLVPFSNNAEFTSYPSPQTASAMGGLDEIARIDAIAAAQNGGETIDIPSATGFCLYIKRACRAVLGEISTAYLRGYGEDTDLSLRARDFGFRVACATGVYVGHAGGRSFKDGKRRLVMINRKILERAYPRFREEAVTFAARDPLRAARRRIDLELASIDAITLFVAADPASEKLIQERAAEREDGCLILKQTPDKRVRLYSAKDTPPKNLSFDLSERSSLSELRSYLDRLTIKEIELANPWRLDPTVLELFSGQRLKAFVSERFIAGKKTEPNPCPAVGSTLACFDCRLGATRARLGATAAARLNGFEDVEAADQMSAAFASSLFACNVGVSTSFVPPTGERWAPDSSQAQTLAIVCPIPDADADRLIQLVAAFFRRLKPDQALVVIGCCQNESKCAASGNLWATGAVEASEHRRILASFNVGAILLPYRTGYYWLVERLRHIASIPIASFDWSSDVAGRQSERPKLTYGPRDIFLDPDGCCEHTARGVIKWFERVVTR